MGQKLAKMFAVGVREALKVFKKGPSAKTIAAGAEKVMKEAAKGARRGR